MGDLERLGDSAAFGMALLDLLCMDGWELSITNAGFAEQRTGQLLVTMTKGHLQIRRTCREAAEVAGEIFAEAMQLQGHRLVA